MAALIPPSLHLTSGVDRALLLGGALVYAWTTHSGKVIAKTSRRNDDNAPAKNATSLAVLFLTLRHQYE